MTGGEARNEIETLAGAMSSEMKRELLPAKLVFQWINRGADQLATRLFCLTGISQATTTSSQSLYRLPDDCVKVISVVYDDKPLVRMTENLATMIDTNTGTPSYYSIHQPNGIRLYPSPDEAKTLYTHYYRRPTHVAQDADDIDLPLELAQICVDYGIWRYYQTYQPEMADDAFRKFEVQFQLYAKNARRMDAPERVQPRDDFFGGDEYLEPRFELRI